MKKNLLSITIFILSFILASCGTNEPVEPSVPSVPEVTGSFEDSYLFIEFESATTVEYKEGSFHIGGGYDPKGDYYKEYYFDEAKRSIKIDKSVSNIKIDTSNKFIFGSIFKWIDPPYYNIPYYNEDNSEIYQAISADEVRKIYNQYTITNWGFIKKSNVSYYEREK